MTVTQSSPSSRTASSSNSGKTVRLSGRRVVVGDSREAQLIMGHIPQSCQYLQNRVECSLSRGAAESMGLHSQAADSGKIFISIAIKSHRLCIKIFILLTFVPKVF